MQYLMILMAALCMVLPTHGSAKTVRAGIFVGSNHGSYTEDDLFYATDDAFKVYQAFLSYGGLEPKLSFLLQDETKDSLESTFGELDQRIQLVREHDPNAQVECIFYYSGHGGTDGLHLDGAVYPHKALGGSLATLPCDLTVVILDACHSGAFLGAKGFTFSEEEFRVKLHDTKTGQVFITSSAATEFAQEKDELKGSVFTYHLVNGLLGAADVDGDQQVTLGEAYNHASTKTIQDTFGSAKGFQVPSYKYDVQGSRDTVLTILGGATVTKIAAPKGFHGVLTFMDEDKGIIWGDFQVDTDTAKVAVPAGKYLVRLTGTTGELSLSTVTVDESGSASWSEPQGISSDSDPLKGARVLHHWNVIMGGATWLAPETTIFRDLTAGGTLSVIVDNILIPPMYAGVQLSLGAASTTDTVYGTEVTSGSLIVGIDGVFGVKKRFGRLFQLAGELHLGGGYASLSRTLLDVTTSREGYLFDAGLWGRMTWWVSKDIGLALPTIGVSLVSYEAGGSITTTVSAGLMAGVQLEF